MFARKFRYLVAGFSLLTYIFLILSVTNLLGFFKKDDLLQHVADVRLLLICGWIAGCLTQLRLLWIQKGDKLSPIGRFLLAPPGDYDQFGRSRDWSLRFRKLQLVAGLVGILLMVLTLLSFWFPLGLTWPLAHSWLVPVIYLLAVFGTSWFGRWSR